MENPTPENAWIYNEGSTSAMTWVANMNPYEIGVKDWTPPSATTFPSAEDRPKRATTFLWATNARKVCTRSIRIFKTDTTSI